jgi:ABC-type sugar transport system substrate-binding protein
MRNAATLRTPRGLIGRIQARQALRLVRPGASVVLATGAAASVTARERKRGFMELAKGRLSVQSVDGRWSAPRAQTARFRVRSEGDRFLDLVVSQNDAMAVGIRHALTQRAAVLRRPGLESVPVIGCDGLEGEGQAMVTRGELAATTVLPPRTRRAIETLVSHWNGGQSPETVLLEATSLPPLPRIGLRVAGAS